METYHQDIKRNKIEKELVEQKNRIRRFNHLVHEMNQSGGNYNSSFNNLVTGIELNNLKSSSDQSRLMENINEQIQYIEINIQKLPKNDYKKREAIQEKKRLVKLKNILLKK